MVREECLPNMICTACYKELERYYAFRKRCEVTYQKLKSHVMAMRARELTKGTTDKTQKHSTQYRVENLPNAEMEGQHLVLAYNDSEQLEIVNVTDLNGVQVSGDIQVLHCYSSLN